MSAPELVPAQAAPVVLVPDVPVKPVGLLRGLIRQARPKQWVKNVLVGAAPGAAGAFELSTLGACALAFAAFSLASSAVYYLNDLLDVEADRAHPEKRFRPIASGAVPIRLAWVVSVLLAAASIAVALTANLATCVVIVVYLITNLGYCLGLKHVNVLDLALVSSGFLLRSLAGGTAASIPISSWFLLVTGFGSLFMVAGKRYAEVALMGEGMAATRKSLAGYSASYLRFVWMAAASVTLMTYCLWAFEVTSQMQPGGSGVRWPQLSVVPFTLAMLAYAYVVDSGKAGKPEDVVLGSPVLPSLGAVWVILFSLGVLHV